MTVAGPRHRALLYIHQLPIANPTGVHRYAIELAEALVRTAEDFETVLGSGRTPGVPDPALNVPIVHPRAPRRLLHGSWILTSRPTIERVVDPFDLLHLTLPTFPVRSAAPQVLTVHDLLPIHHPEWYSPRDRRTFERAVRFGVKAAAELITPSQVVADDLAQTLGVAPERITVVPEGVERGFAMPADAAAAAATCTSLGVTDRPFVATLGAITARKNLAVVFEALVRLRDDGDAVDFVVIGGDGLGAAETRAVADRLGVADLVHFAGRLPDRAVRDVLSRASALVHPSRYEGFGLTPLEAMAAGVPVIASRAGSLPEVLGVAARFANPDDAQDWATAIAAVVGDRDLADRLRRAGLDHVAGYTWDRAAAGTAQVYRRALDR